MNIDEMKKEQSITDKIKVVVPVHYAGIVCKQNERILRLPIYYGLYSKFIKIVTHSIKEFFNETK